MTEDMTMTTLNPKQRVAIEAAKLVKDGMVVGLGTGSTANYFIEELARLQQQDNLQVKAVSSSVISSQYAQKLGLDLLAIEHITKLDLYVDGADEISPELHVLKGRGQDLVKEKLLANAADQFIVVADNSKLVDAMGDNFPIPIEVMPEASNLVLQQLRQLGGEGDIRLNASGGASFSAAGSVVLDMAFDMPAEQLNQTLNVIPGIVEHGLFIGLASTVLIADDNDVSKMVKS
jgi:ribose 5-phosphate isomerase A